MTVGLTPATVIRASYTGDLGYEIWCTPDYQVTLYEALTEAGRDLGLVHFGNRALMSLRLEKGYGAFFREFRPDYTPKEAVSTGSSPTTRAISSAARRRCVTGKKVPSAASSR